jgi:hypothetical protein
MTKKEQRRLKRRRKQLAALLPLVSQSKQDDLRREIMELDGKLQASPSFPTDRRKLGANFPVSASGIDGVGSLRFQANSPPGQKRLLRLPFYLYNVEPDIVSQGNIGAHGPPAGGRSLYVTGNGDEVADESNPVVIVNLPSFLEDGTNVNNTSFSSKVVGLKFRTPQIEWADLQIVGLTLWQKRSPFLGYNEAATTPSPVPGTAAAGYITPTGQFAGGATAAYYTNLPAHIFLNNFTVGGGANLFMQDGFVDGNIFDERIPDFAGLRAYPKLDSPNRAYLDVAVQGGGLATVTFCVSLICEDLRDVQYGKGIPGPYVRRDASSRETNEGGNVYVGS